MTDPFSHSCGRLGHPQPDLELGDVAHDEDDHHEDRDAVLDPRIRPRREPDAFALVGLGEEVLPTPAIAARAEDHIEQATERQHVVGDDEVLEALDVADARHLEPRHPPV